MIVQIRGLAIYLGIGTQNKDSSKHHKIPSIYLTYVIPNSFDYTNLLGKWLGQVYSSNNKFRSIIEPTV